MALGNLHEIMSHLHACELLAYIRTHARMVVSKKACNMLTNHSEASGVVTVYGESDERIMVTYTNCLPSTVGIVTNCLHSTVGIIMMNCLQSTVCRLASSACN